MLYITFTVTKKQNTDKNIAKPFLKWAGGKGQLLEHLRKHYPDDLKKGNITNYYEPFLGGGAVFFDVAQRYIIDKARLYDINEELILTYKVVQKEVERLIDFLHQYQEKYLPLNQTERKGFYYNIRETFNRERFGVNYQQFSDNWIPRAAQIIFLNKTCYNGLFRFNSSRAFNTPMGDYSNPKICDGKNLKKSSELLQKAEISCNSYEQVLDDVEPEAFVYFDPPYRPISKTSNFTAYSKNVFLESDQRKLANVFGKLAKKNVAVMLSNSDPKNTNPNDQFFDDIYSEFTLRRIPARRMINSVAGKRNDINEIIVTNYN